MYTIPEIDEIAERATQRISDDFDKFHFQYPKPRVTHGIARAVLEAAEQCVLRTETPFFLATRSPRDFDRVHRTRASARIPKFRRVRKNLSGSARR